MGIRATTNVNPIRNLDSIAGDRVDQIRRDTAIAHRGAVAKAVLELAGVEGFRGDVRGFQQEQQDANDGVSLVRTALGSLDRTGSILGRVRELTAQAETGTLSEAQRATATDELSSLVGEVDQIANSTEFGGVRLLDGSAGSVSVQVGAGSGQDGAAVRVPLPNTSARALGIDTLEQEAPADASAAVDSAIAQVTSDRQRLATVQARLSEGLRALGARAEGVAPGASPIRDANLAGAAAVTVGEEILGAPQQSVLAQANVEPRRALALLAAG